MLQKLDYLDRTVAIYSHNYSSWKIKIQRLHYNQPSSLSHYLSLALSPSCFASSRLFDRADFCRLPLSLIHNKYNNSFFFSSVLRLQSRILGLPYSNINAYAYSAVLANIFLSFSRQNVHRRLRWLFLRPDYNETLAWHSAYALSARDWRKTFTRKIIETQLADNYLSFSRRYGLISRNRARINFASLICPSKQYKTLQLCDAVLRNLVYCRLRFGFKKKKHVFFF